MGLKEAGDHPRIRGEKVWLRWRAWFIWGSSPHTRGKVIAEGGHLIGAGIIPAYAGKSEAIAAIKDQWRDHPRIRGEKPAFLAKENAERGSSPHTRGKVGPDLDVNGFDGIIPAYAGKSCKLVLSRDKILGSSPHTRGKVIPPQFIACGTGIIPAYAGKSGSCSCTDPGAWDHPRIRGEK